VRGIQFSNPSPNAAPVTVTFRHGLGRQYSGLHAVRSQGAAWARFDAPNPNGTDPTQYATVTTMVPGAVNGVPFVATHDFCLFAD
jgi:hypothetical protein